MNQTINYVDYDVSWEVSVSLPASMKVKAPPGLNEKDLINYIRGHCRADFVIDVENLEYDDGFAEISHFFEYEEVNTEE